MSRKIILAVTGSIAAYKAALILREFQKRGWDVQVVMTENATRFVAPLTFQALSGQKVIVDQFRDLSENGLDHIFLTEGADALLVAPATANIIAKFACGIADDFLSSLYLACKVPVFIAPAMNDRMYLHPATQENLQKLQERGVVIISPQKGELACREEGIGRLREPVEIVEIVISHLEKKQSLKGFSILVTAGPTREYIDDVRFISNPSSGRQGVYIAEEAARRGADVLLLLSKASPLKTFVKTEYFETVEELRHRIEENLHRDIFIMAAAVGDFIPEKKEGKIRREGELTVKFRPSPDLLKELFSTRRSNQIVIGFAAEVEDPLIKGKKKLKDKKVDLLFANPVGSNRGFATEENEGFIIYRNGKVEKIERTSKREIAEKILDALEKVINERA